MAKRFRITIEEGNFEPVEHSIKKSPLILATNDFLLGIDRDAMVIPPNDPSLFIALMVLFANDFSLSKFLKMWALEIGDALANFKQTEPLTKSEATLYKLSCDLVEFAKSSYEIINREKAQKKAPPFWNGPSSFSVN